MSDNGKDPQTDWVGKGFHRLDPKVVNRNAPRIRWGFQFEGWTDWKKIDYLKKLAASMNHAAFLLQTERDELNRLLHAKEDKLRSMAKAIDDNNAIMQQLTASLNSEREQSLKHAKQLNARIKVLENAQR